MELIISHVPVHLDILGSGVRQVGNRLESQQDYEQSRKDGRAVDYAIAHENNHHRKGVVIPDRHEGLIVI